MAHITCTIHGTIHVQYMAHITNHRIFLSQNKKKKTAWKTNGRWEDNIKTDLEIR